MACAGKVLVLVAGAGIYVDTDARKRAGKGFAGDANAIWEGGEAIKFDRILANAMSADAEWIQSCIY